MALAKLNLDPPPPTLGPSNLLHRSVARPDDLMIPSCPDFTEVVFSSFRSAPSSRPDRVAHTLAVMADAQDKGLGNMPSVEPCISSLILFPDQALKQELRCLTRSVGVLIICWFVYLTHFQDWLVLRILWLICCWNFIQPCHQQHRIMLRQNCLRLLYRLWGQWPFLIGKHLGLSHKLVGRCGWLSPGSLEVCRNNLCQLPLAPGQIFGPAAQEALECRVTATEFRSQHIGCRLSYPALAAQRLPARHSTL